MIFFQNPVDPVFYTRMLQAAYPAIKAADPEAVVVGGVVLAAYTAGSVAINPQDFLATMYENGAKGYFDAISYHPYHPDIPFSQSGIFLRGALRQYREMRAVMDLNGDEELKVWISEYGLPTATAGGTTVDEAYQARFIEDLLEFLADRQRRRKTRRTRIHLHHARLCQRRSESSIQLRSLLHRLDTEAGRVHHRAVRWGSCRSAPGRSRSPDHRCGHCVRPRDRQRDGAGDQRRRPTCSQPLWMSRLR